jgi:hypothetical protein
MIGRNWNPCLRAGGATDLRGVHEMGEVDGDLGGGMAATSMTARRWGPSGSSTLRAGGVTTGVDLT